MNHPRIRGTMHESDEEENVPKSVHIREAENGFIAEKRGGKIGHDSIELVSKDLKPLLKKCGEFLGSGNSEDNG